MYIFIIIINFCVFFVWFTFCFCFESVLSLKHFLVQVSGYDFSYDGLICLILEVAIILGNSHELYNYV